jgi:twitching motility protein PilT
MDKKVPDNALSITELLDFAVKNQASDLHLSAGLPPMFRIDGSLRVFDYPVLQEQELMHLGVVA